MHQTFFYCAPGSYGDAIANEGASFGDNRWEDFIDVGDFSVFCNGGYQTANFGYGANFHWAFNSYRRVDSWNRFSRINMYDPRTVGFYYNGRGEAYYEDLNAIWAGTYGHYADATMDSRWLQCNSSGSKLTGWRGNRSAAIELLACKSFYSGASGGTDEANSANFAFLADQDNNGQVQMHGCESQESRGSGVWLRSGYNYITGLTVSDPARASSAIGAGTRPAVRAAIQIRNFNSGNNSGSKNTIFAKLSPSVSLYDGTNGDRAQIGTHDLWLDSVTSNTKGQILTQRPSGALWEDASCAWNSRTFGGTQGAQGGSIGGPGFTSGLNLGINVDGVSPT